MSKMEPEEKVAAAIGCLWILFSIAWLAFVVWAVITVIQWLVTK